MAISAEHIGRGYPPTAAYPVAEAKIAEFARAIGDQNPAYFGADAVAPPTFAFVIASTAWEALFADPDLDLALHRILHADQQFRFQRPIRAGDQIIATLTIDKVRQRGPADMIGTSVQLTDIAGNDVATVTATLLHSREDDAS